MLLNSVASCQICKFSLSKISPYEDSHQPFLPWTLHARLNKINLNYNNAMGYVLHHLVPIQVKIICHPFVMHLCMKECDPEGEVLNRKWKCVSNTPPPTPPPPQASLTAYSLHCFVE